MTALGGNHYDVIVAGSGAGGMTAAAVAAAEGLRVLLVEKTPAIGGTTAISGGMVWLPANDKMHQAGLTDSIESAATYLAHAVPGDVNAGARRAFLTRAREALAYLEARTALRFRPVARYPDYFPDLPGATEGGRVLEPVTFDGRDLGKHFALLRPPLPEFTLFGGMMVDRADIPHLRRVGRSLASTIRTSHLLARYAYERLSATRGTTLVLGNALAGRLLRSLLDLGVEIRLEAAVKEILHDGRRVRGAVVSGHGRDEEVRAAAVVLATGGFSHDADRRARYLPALARHTAVAPGATGDGLRLGEAVGGTVATQPGGNAFWVPVSLLERQDGSQAAHPHTVTDRAKPGAIVVDRTGRRYLNEAVSYHEFVRAMLAASPSAVPSYLVCDSTFLRKYGLGAVKPFTPNVVRFVRSGYLVQGSSLAELASRLGIPPEPFADTVATYNAAARQGSDPLYGRGENVYQRHLGDADQKPNPCIAPLERPPFYAVALHPGDLGTAAGLTTDETARVLGRAGEPIDGLYACGNDMQSVMNGAYPGPGITLGPAMVFGYIAGRCIAAVHDRQPLDRD